MFDDEADTITVDPKPIGFDTQPMLVDAFEVTKPIELKAPSDTFRETGPFEKSSDTFEVADTDVLVVSLAPIEEEVSTTDVSVGRPGTNADWPPVPKEPANRQHRRAGMYKAISSITKLNSLKRTSSSNS